MSYERQKELIGTLHKVIAEQKEAMRVQKAMIKNLSENHVKIEIKKEYRVPHYYLN